MYALTVWQPWAWAIGAGIKLVENRNWLPSWRLVKEGDDIAIHGSVHAPTRDDMAAVRAAARHGGHTAPDSSGHELGLAYGRGRIVAVATFIGVARAAGDLPEDQRPWWVGPYGWRLANVRQLELGTAPKLVGQQGLWALPVGVEEGLRQRFRTAPGQTWRKTA